MTDNISRMYELANVEKKRKYFIKDKIKGCYFVTYKDGVIKHFNNSVPSKRNKVVRVVTYYEKFNSKKHLELIKWISLNTCFMWNYIGQTVKNTWVLAIDYTQIFKFKSCEHKDFSQALAGLVCELWEDLTDEQREEVRGILE